VPRCSVGEERRHVRCKRFSGAVRPAGASRSGQGKKAGNRDGNDLTNRQGMVYVDK
jgi:hypothetical protein